MALFNKKSPHFTNDLGVYVQCSKGFYLKATRNEDNSVSLAKVVTTVNGDTSVLFEGIKPWHRISEEKWEKETESARAGWHSWHEELVLQFCFECAGKKYFTIESDKVPAGRFYASQFTLDQLKCGMSADMQQAYRDAINDAVNNGDLARIAVLVKEQDYRAKVALDIDLITAFASIMIVEEGEDIANFDADFNKKKVETWRKYMGDTFFLNAPIKHILPFLSMSEEDFQAMIQRGKEIQESSLIKAWQQKFKKEATT